MATSEALHDRFQRNTMFAVRLAICQQKDPKDKLITGIRDTGARIVRRQRQWQSFLSCPEQVPT